MDYTGFPCALYSSRIQLKYFQLSRMANVALGCARGDCRPVQCTAVRRNNVATSPHPLIQRAENLNASSGCDRASIIARASAEVRSLTGEAALQPQGAGPAPRSFHPDCIMFRFFNLSLFQDTACVWPPQQTQQTASADSPAGSDSRIGQRRDSRICHSGSLYKYAC